MEHRDTHFSCGKKIHQQKRMDINAIDRKAVEEMWQSIYPGEMCCFKFALSIYIRAWQLLHFFDAAIKAKKTVPEQHDVKEIWEDFRQNGYNDIAYDHGSPQIVINENTSEQPPQIKSNKTSGHAMRNNVETMEQFYCEFCFKNTNETNVYHGHRCKDERGFVCCPILQTVVCPYCKATGPMAHTPKYCPIKPIITLEYCEAMEQRKYEESNTEAYCRYCRNFGHTCKDENGIVRCPIMQTVVCSYCKATGLRAHTLRNCPIKPFTIVSRKLQYASEKNRETKKMSALEKTVRANEPMENEVEK